ncbi:MAG TPA: tetratricopeptide repeat protein [Gemmatimonadota bacterium]|nr:tetratricopeptide repeat protein [Gemmatimonadota bacterium]
MSTYTTREVARILDVPTARVHGFVRAGIVVPKRGAGNAYMFSFRDLLVMRTALQLEGSDVSRRRVNAALRALRERLPEDRPLSSLRILVQEGELVIDDDRARWNPDSGQTLLDFELPDMTETLHLIGAAPATGRDAEGWFELACSLEGSSPRMARELYRRALELEPDHVDARINLGRLQHEDGQLEEARRQYERALESAPGHPTAAYNLGVVLEDMGEIDDAIHAYQLAIASDREMADAYYNLARLYDQAGDRAAALRHLKSYSELVRGH